MEGRVKEVREALEQNAPKERLNDLLQQLTAEAQEIGAAIYQPTEDGTPGNGAFDGEMPGSDGGGDEDPKEDDSKTVEGEFREV